MNFIGKIQREPCELDTTRMEARLPADKLQRTRDLLHSFTTLRSVRLVELQSLIGTLQFAYKAVVPGRTFLQRMINLTRGALSRFHHIRLNFIDTTVTPSPDLEVSPTSLAPLLLGPISMGNGSRVGGPLTCS